MTPSSWRASLAWIFTVASNTLFAGYLLGWIPPGRWHVTAGWAVLVMMNAGVGLHISQGTQRVAQALGLQLPASLGDDAAALKKTA